MANDFVKLLCSLWDVKIIFNKKKVFGQAVKVDKYKTLDKNQIFYF